MIRHLLRCSLLAALVAVGCGTNRRVDGPYQACAPGDGCAQGTVCAGSTLPASAGYTGNLCTTGCNTTNDCLQDLSNYAAICVNSQCYIQCPQGGSTCPYGTGCLTFQDQSGNRIDLCTP